MNRRPMLWGLMAAGISLFIGALVAAVVVSDPPLTREESTRVGKESTSQKKEPAPAPSGRRKDPQPATAKEAEAIAREQVMGLVETSLGCVKTTLGALAARAHAEGREAMRKYGTKSYAVDSLHDDPTDPTPMWECTFKGRLQNGAHTAIVLLSTPETPERYPNGSGGYFTMPVASVTYRGATHGGPRSR